MLLTDIRVQKQRAHDRGSGAGVFETYMNVTWLFLVCQLLRTVQQTKQQCGECIRFVIKKERSDV